MTSLQPPSLLAVCLGEPTVENASTNWDETSTYHLGSSVVATCLPSHFAPGDVPSQLVTCTNTSWEEVAGCYEACDADPPPAGENMVRRNYSWSGIGAAVHYDCVPGFSLVGSKASR